jgi:excisionase family DNA binding protein
MIREGQLPSIKIGTNIRVPLRALEEWIEKNTEGGEKK